MDYRDLILEKGPVRLTCRSYVAIMVPMRACFDVTVATLTLGFFVDVLLLAGIP